jgi:hypothetical protein
MDRRSFGVAFGMLVASACAERITESKVSLSQPRTLRDELVFVTRDECTDPRTGYPTPTVLYKNRDLFGMPPPTPPFPEPS